MAENQLPNATVEYARLLADVAQRASRSLTDIRLPLHILLENHFGELNENQEEMLAAARAAADIIERDLETLSEIAKLELGESQLRRDRVFPADVLEAIRPTIVAAAARGVTVRFDVDTPIPPLTADRMSLQAALVTLLGNHVAIQPADSLVEITLSCRSGETLLNVQSQTSAIDSLQTILARMTLLKAGISVEENPGVLSVNLSPRTIHARLGG